MKKVAMRAAEQTPIVRDVRRDPNPPARTRRSRQDLALAQLAATCKRMVNLLDDLAGQFILLEKDLAVLKAKKPRLRQ